MTALVGHRGFVRWPIAVLHRKQKAFEHVERYRDVNLLEIDIVIFSLLPSEQHA